MDINTQLKSFIDTQRLRGVSDQEIAQSLFDSGWPQDLVYGGLQQNSIHTQQVTMVNGGVAKNGISVPEKYTVRALYIDVVKSIASKPHLFLGAIIVGVALSVLFTFLSAQLMTALLSTIGLEAFFTRTGLILSVLFLIVTNWLSGLSAIAFVTVAQRVTLTRTIFKSPTDINLFTAPMSAVKVVVTQLLFELLVTVFFVAFGSMNILATILFIGSGGSSTINIATLVGYVVWFILLIIFILRTFFVTPAVIFEPGTGPIRAYRRSSALIGQPEQWLFLKFGLSLLLLLIPVVIVGDLLQPEQSLFEPEKSSLVVDLFMGAASMLLLTFYSVGIAHMYRHSRLSSLQ